MLRTCKRCRQELSDDRFESKLKTVCSGCNEAKNILGKLRNNEESFSSKAKKRKRRDRKFNPQK